MSERFLESGLHPGIVTSVTGDKSGLNKVKVKLVEKGIELDHAPVMTHSVGDNYGWVSIPRKGDSVLVGFMDNKMQRPVVLGSYPNPKRKPPIKIKSDNNKKFYKTASGMEIEIDESKKSSKINIKAKNGHTITFNDNSKSNLVEIKSKDSKTLFKIDLKKSTIELKAKSIKLNADKDISLKSGDSSISLKNSSGMALKSPKGKMDVNVNNVNMNANTNIKINSKSTVTVQGNSVANLKSASMVNVKGSLVKIG